ncbi:hypothetical protein HMI54_011391 [Coelomomyces lativittatus]|nr:hypothetical protein HMI54_011391 [Coelomomyces lativittatus]
MSSITSLYVRPQKNSSKTFTQLFNMVLENKFTSFQAYLRKYPHHVNLLHPQTHQPLIFCIFHLFPSLSMSSSTSNSTSSTKPTLNETAYTSTTSGTLGPLPSSTSTSTSTSSSNTKSSSNSSSSSSSSSTALMSLSTTTDLTLYLHYLFTHFLKDIYTAHDVYTKNSILMMAIHFKNLPLIQCILDHATLTMRTYLMGIRNKRHECPLILACIVGEVEIVQYLIDFSSENETLHLTDDEGNTLLHYAKSYNHYALVSYLIAKGGNFMARNKKQWSVSDYAYSFEMQWFFEDALKTWMQGFGTTSSPLSSLPTKLDNNVDVEKEGSTFPLDTFYFENEIFQLKEKEKENEKHIHLLFPYS